MSQKIDAREVLAYLNQMGYTNINAQQLKEFITDLKKLIKYEKEVQKATRKYDSQSGYIADTDLSLSNNFPFSSTVDTSKNDKSDVFSSLYHQETVASKAKKKPKESVISVQIKRPALVPSYKPVSHDHCVHNSLVRDMLEGTQEKSRSDTDLLRSDTSRFQLTEAHTEATQDTVDDVPPSRPSSCPKTCRSKITLKPKASFIRPRICRTFKTDPVALYHQYQEEWKKLKIPGEDSRLDLRWAIRERMLGDPAAISTAPSMECIGRRRHNSCCSRA